MRIFQEHVGISGLQNVRQYVYEAAKILHRKSGKANGINMIQSAVKINNESERVRD
eukprot:CAMPEP_0194493412 /NCGR_PEP_ID=MMETSP0253-20130528/11641_1 /TAXON_ID=2966 /ORGANISM="Noctiluca scintillans" /LENGTH=55 /DNA_ID=CAMNT_0039334397 /DNA_START=158 /DNA_END=325 /DNA_ORIENTATION=-